MKRKNSEVYRNSRHLLALVDDILDLSKLEAGKMGLRREDVDFVSLLEDATELVRPLTETKGLTLSLEIASSLPSLQVDRTRINQVLLNLLSNATRVTSCGGVVVRAFVRQDEAVVQVKDTGPGIAEEDLCRVFDEFRQLDHTANVSGTTGLGLTVSKQILELHDGHVWVESELGKGSTFSFSLPLHPFVSPTVSTKSPSLSATGKPEPAIVFLGDVESDEAKLLERHLDGYYIVGAPSIESARKAIEEFSARAVIENTSPGFDVNDSPFPVPLIVCPLPGPQSSRDSLNVDGYLQKPVTLRSLQSALLDVAPESRSVLIVDDSRSAVRLIERMVVTVEPECRIFRAYSGNQALARIHAQRPDVVILDLVMADGDGYWLIEELRGNPATRDIPVIVMSGQPVEETNRREAIRVMANEGFATTELLRYLRAILSVTPPYRVERHTIGRPS